MIEQPKPLYSVAYIDKWGNTTPKDYVPRNLKSARKLVRGLNASDFVKRVKLGRYVVVEFRE